MKSPVFESEHCIIRPFRADDAVLWQEWERDPQVRAFMPEPFDDARDIEGQRRYIDECEADGEGFYWSIETKDGVTIGTVSLTEFNAHHGVADLGIVIGDGSYRGKGVATEIVSALVGYAFGHLSIARIGAEVEAGNIPMEKVLEKVGFRRDGIFESARVKNGRRINVHHFGIVDSAVRNG